MRVGLWNHWAECTGVLEGMFSAARGRRSRLVRPRICCAMQRRCQHRFHIVACQWHWQSTTPSSNAGESVLCYFSPSVHFPSRGRDGATNFSTRCSLYFRDGDCAFSLKTDDWAIAIASLLAVSTDAPNYPSISKAGQLKAQFHYRRAVTHLGKYSCSNLTTLPAETLGIIWQCAPAVSSGP